MMQTLFARLAQLCLLSVMALAAPAVAADPVQGIVRTDQPGPVISRHIYGQFAEHLGRGVYDGIWVGPESTIPNTRGIRNDVVAALKEIAVPVVRWPGGCFADEYHWRDGVGPASKRPVRRNNWWDGVESNAFGTHEFFDFAEQVGADTYLSVNVASSTPTEMREWLEYLTSKGQDTIANERRANGRQSPFKLDFVGIGNESWGCGGNMTPDYYANELRRFGTFFHKNGTAFHDNNDNTAMRVASGANNLDTNWTDVVTKQAGHQVDAISLHFYALKTGDWMNRNQAKAIGFPESEWNGILYQAMRMDEVLNAHEAVLDRNDPDKRISLFVDEWGSWYAPEAGTNPAHLYQQNSLRDALLTAGTFNIFHRHTARVRMANIAQAVNVLQAMLLTDGPAMVRTPTYYVFRMYKPFQGARPFPVAMESPLIKTPEGSFPAISITAARGTDGKVHVAVANMALNQSYSLTLDLGALKPDRVSGEILTHARMDAYNQPGKPEVVHPARYDDARVKGNHVSLDLPAKSVITLQFD
jgi:alpha-N-arabinofuranosidase